MTTDYFISAMNNRLCALKALYARGKWNGMYPDWLAGMGSPSMMTSKQRVTALSMADVLIDEIMLGAHNG